jgi:hypothetical protein
MTYISKRNYFALFRFFLLVLILHIFSGCQKVINVELNNAAAQIVIEGIITNKPGPYIVSISKSGSYFNQPVLPPVSGAEVIITDDTGIIDTLSEAQPGIYFTSVTQGIPGRTYTLKVLSENSEYTGSSKMFSKVPIDTLRLARSQSHHIGLGGNNEVEINVEIHCLFKDPEEKNFYRLKVFRNDTTNAENYRLYDDEYTNGQETELRATHVNPGNTYRIELYSLDKSTYLYYRTLEDLLHTNPIFGSTPANPNTNLNNGALGYFGACAVSTKTILVTDSLFNTIR